MFNSLMDLTTEMSNNLTLPVTLLTSRYMVLVFTPNSDCAYAKDMVIKSSSVDSRTAEIND